MIGKDERQAKTETREIRVVEQNYNASACLFSDPCSSILRCKLNPGEKGGAVNLLTQVPLDMYSPAGHVELLPPMLSREICQRDCQQEKFANRNEILRANKHAERRERRGERRGGRGQEQEQGKVYVVLIHTCLCCCAAL